jgi:cell wall-associated NlpC family hydrolase
LINRLSKYLLLIVLLITAITYPPAAFPAEPLKGFDLLLKKDTGLSDTEKMQWQAIAEGKLKGKGFSFDYSGLLYSILSRAKFDEVALDRGINVALDCILAVQNGGPHEEVEELAVFAFSTDLTPAEITRYALAFHRCNEADVPVNISQELIRHAKERDLPAATFDKMIQGLLTAAQHNVDLEKVALFMLISVDQKLGTVDKIVDDALLDAQKREPTRWKEERRPASSVVTPAKTPSVALDFDTYRRSVESFLGTPYVWGGTDRLGVDCSGFTRLVMKENGYTVPRTSREQSTIGTSIKKEDLRLGDLLFFDTKGAGSVTHVGFYLGGNIVVHASSSKGVTIVLYSDPYLQSRHLFSRRVVRYADR